MRSILVGTPCAMLKISCNRRGASCEPRVRVKSFWEETSRGEKISLKARKKSFSSSYFLPFLIVV
ncbi:hypothetical protein YC2023_084933 [Brassica napus]